MRSLQQARKEELSRRVALAQSNHIWTDELEEAIEVALDPESVEDYREDDTTLESFEAAEVLDKAIKSSKLFAPVTLYRAYDGVKDLKGFTEGAYFVGSTSPVKGDSVVKVEIPAGACALRVDDHYILLRGLTVKNGKVSFAVESHVAMMKLWPSGNPDEFFNKNHAKSDGQFTSGKGGGGGSAGGPKAKEPDVDAEAARKQRIKNILVGAAVVAVAGLVLLGVHNDLKAAPAKKVHTEADTKRDTGHLIDRRAQERYTQFEGVLLNHSLRGTKPTGGQAAEVARKDAAETKALGVDPVQKKARFLADLDRAFTHNAVDAKGVTVYRGMTADKALLDRLQPGATFTDAGFISTAHSRANAKEYVSGGLTTAKRDKDHKPVLISIKTQQGTKVMAGYDHPQLKELVLNRGTTLKINQVRHCPDGICRIQAEVVE